MPTKHTVQKSTPITIKDVEYNLYFDFAAMYDAETSLKKQGLKVNLLRNLDLTELDATGLAAVFYATLLRDQPEITFPEVLELFTFESLPLIYKAIIDTFNASQPDAKEKESPNV